MKEEQQHLHHHHQRKIITINKLTRPTAYILLLLLSYILGYLSAPSSSSAHSRTTGTAPILTTAGTATITTIAGAAISESELGQFRVTRKCGDPVPSKLVRKTILDQVFNGTSPFDLFPPPHVAHLLRPKRIKGWGSNGAVFENLIRRVKPRTIIEVGTFLGASAIHMAEVASQLGLKTQIICLDDFRGWPGFRDRFKDIAMINGDVMLLYQFMQNVIHVNATDSILPVPFSTASTLDKLCALGVLGDLIEVDAGHDFNSAWSDINRAYRILRPGGVIFGHDYFTSADNKAVRRAVNLFARVNKLRVQLDGEHWVIDSA